MKSYWSIFSAKYRSLLQYRAAALAGSLTQVFWGLIRVMIFYGFYHSTTQIQPMSYEQVVTYVWLAQATILLIFLNPDSEVKEMIETGTVAYELVRPVKLYQFWFCRSAAGRLAPLSLRFFPIVLIAGLFMGLKPPDSFLSGIFYFISTLAAILLASSVITILSITLFWTISGEGVTRLLQASFYFLSGSVVPLPFFPEWIQPILKFLPFRGIQDIPLQIYMGMIPTQEAVLAIGHQVVWIIIFILLGQWLLNRGIRQLVVQGG